MAIYSGKDDILEYSWRGAHQNVIHATAFEVHDTMQVCHQSYSGRPSIIYYGTQSRVSIRYSSQQVKISQKLTDNTYALYIHYTHFVGSTDSNSVLGYI